MPPLTAWVQKALFADTDPTNLGCTQRTRVRGLTYIQFRWSLTFLRRVAHARCLVFWAHSALQMLILYAIFFEFKDLKLYVTVAIFLNFANIREEHQPFCFKLCTTD